MLKLGALTSQLGSSYLWQNLLKPFRSVDAHRRELLETHVRNALRIVEGSAELRGAFTKLVQMLSMRDDLLPPGGARRARRGARQRAADALPDDSRAVARRARQAAGTAVRALRARGLCRRFARTSAPGRASLRRTVVVKIQYPGIEETVEQDLQNVQALLQIVHAHRPRRDAAARSTPRASPRARGTAARRARLSARSREPGALPRALRGRRRDRDSRAPSRPSARVAC